MTMYTKEDIRKAGLSPVGHMIKCTKDRKVKTKVILKVKSRRPL